MNRWTDRHVGDGRMTDGGGSVSGRAPAAPPTPHRPACPGLGILGRRPHARTRRPGSHRLPSATSTAVSAQLGDARHARPVARPLPPPRPAAVSTLPGRHPVPATRHTPAPPATRRPCEPGSPGTVTRGASLCGRLVFLGAVSSVLSPWRDFLPPPGRPSSIAGHGRWALPGCRDAAWNAGAQTPVPSPRVPACGDLARRPPGRERAGRRSERGLLCRSR